MAGRDKRTEISARPRPAASLVLHRRGASGVEVLMGRRASRHRFMPDVYVFPGGGVDASDHRRDVVRELRPDVAQRLEATSTATAARALAIAAVRETWEETGLVIGSLDRGRLRPDLRHLEYVARAITPNGNPIRYHARFFVADAAHAAGEPRDSRELHDLRWFPIDEALALPIIDVTEFVLQQVAATTRTPKRGVPLLRYRRGVRYIRYD